MKPSLPEDCWVLRAPRLNANDEVVTVARWLVPDRAAVRAGQAIAEIETEKATAELVADAEGELVQDVTAGTKVPIGAALAYVGDPAAIEAAREPRTAGRVPAGSHPLKATAKARALATTHGIDLSSVAASGETIKERDVASALALRAGRVQASAEDGEIVSAGKASAHQLRVARNLREALAAGLFTTLAYTLDLRGPQAVIASELAQGRTASLLNVLLLGLARTLPEFPRLASWLGRDGEMWRQRDIDIAFAVRSAAGELQAPAVRRVDQLGLADIARACARLAKSAMRGKLDAKDTGGACFTVSLIALPNVESFVALPAPFQSAILSVGAERRQVETAQGQAQNQITGRPVATATVTYDHAMCDGLYVAEFCAALDRNMNAGRS
jgi:pyruvate/2-oxoglutarate dehydrogenase complex dihydrolipoamide acyltransferase (E2) component